VAATNLENQAWWEVDLGSIRPIKNIKVWNRVEFPARTSDFYVFVSDEPFKSTDLEATKSQLWVKSFFTSGTCGYPTEIAVGKTGRYVRVQLSGADYLQLAEVEVFAGPK
jgi:acyl-coenzyme A synthetase/AMP-(fatty) acid ligase